MDEIAAVQKQIEKYGEAVIEFKDRYGKQLDDINDRMDMFEVAMKRTPKGVPVEQMQNEQNDFDLSLKSTGANRGSVEVGKYNKLMSEYLRYGGASLSNDEQKALSVGVDPYGGYTVHPQLSRNIIQALQEKDPVRKLANIESISGADALEFLVDIDMPDAQWGDETGAVEESEASSLRKARIPVHLLVANPKITQQLIEDSNINIENWLSNKLSDKFAVTEGESFVLGDGVGKPRGFLTYENGTDWGKVEQVNLGAAATVTSGGLITLKYALKSQYQNNAAWVMSRGTVEVIMKLVDGAGRFIWQPSFMSSEPPTLLGLPVYVSPSMPDVAAGALSIAIADWRRAYTIVDRIGVSIQRDPYSYKPYVGYYTRKRVGGDVTNFEAIKIGVIAT